MVKLGITSNAYINSELFHIDFESLSKDGYETIDFQDFIRGESYIYKFSEEEFKNYLSLLKEELDKYSLKISQLHALWHPEMEKMDRSFIKSAIRKAILGASILKCPYVVFHPLSPISWDTPFTKDEIINYNTNFINDLIPLLEKLNVNLAIENLPFFSVPDFFSVKGTYEFIKSFNNENIVMCLDTGHMNMFKDDPYEDILLIKDKLRVLHIHDNNGQSDSHLFPYMGNIDWEKIIKGLKDIDFDGSFSFETGAPKSAPINARREMEIALSLIGKDFKNKINN